MFQNLALLDKSGKNAIAISTATPCSLDARSCVFLGAAVQAIYPFTRKGHASRPSNVVVRAKYNIITYNVRNNVSMYLYICIRKYYV